MIMIKGVVLGMMALLLVACGDDASTDPFLESLFGSVDGLSDLVDDPEVQECLAEAEGELVVCPCPGGGELTAVVEVDRPEVQVTRYVYRPGCADENGLPYTGGQLVTETCEVGTFPVCEESFVDELDFAMPVLGECTEATAISEPNVQCGGSIRATCAGSTRTCSAVPAGDDCRVSCS